MQTMEILAVGIVGGVDVAFIVFRDEIYFQVFIVIFNQNLEIGDKSPNLSFYPLPYIVLINVIVV